MQKLAIALGLLVLAGCVTPPPSDQAPGAQVQALLPHFELSDAHDHKDRAQHDAVWNMQLLGWNPVAPAPTELGRYNQVVVHGTRAFLSVYSFANQSAPGLAIFNVSGLVPTLAAQLATPDLTPIDVFVTADGKYAFLAGHRDNRAALPAAAQTCTGTPAVNLCSPFAPAGIYMVDVQDETRPKLVATYASAPSGAHTVKAHEIGGELFVFIASYGFSYANRLGSSVEIAKVDFSSPAGAQIVPVTRFFAERASGQEAQSSYFVHDLWIEEHPLTKKTLMYVAYWDGGVVIADLTDPASPREIANWRDFDASTYGNVHFVRPVGMIGDPQRICDASGSSPAGCGRHITFATPEFGQAEHAGQGYVLDTTDPAKPALVATWTLPGNPVNDGGYRFSPHNFDVRGSLVVYGHYHGGVWILDMADPASPQVKGYAFPTAPVPTNSADDAPNVWNAVWLDDGTLLASDAGTGLHHYVMLDQEPGTPPYEEALR